VPCSNRSQCFAPFHTFGIRQSKPVASMMILERPHLPCLTSVPTGRSLPLPHGIDRNAHKYEPHHGCHEDRMSLRRYGALRCGHDRDHHNGVAEIASNGFWRDDPQERQTTSGSAFEHHPESISTISVRSKYSFTGGSWAVDRTNWALKLTRSRNIRQRTK